MSLHDRNQPLPQGGGTTPNGPVHRTEGERTQAFTPLPSVEPIDGFNATAAPAAPGKRHHVWPWIVLAVVVLLVAAGFGAFAFFQDRALPGTTLWGHDVVGKTQQQIATMIDACAIRGYDGEQLRVRIVSNTVANLARHFKVSVDDRPKRLDVQVRRGTGISETLAKDDVTVIIWVPQRYVTTVECAAKAQEAYVRGLTCDGLELDVRTPRLSLDDVHTHVEVNCNLDMEIDCASIDGRIDVNQLSSTSRITVPKDVPIAVLTHGLRTRTIVGAGVRQDEDSPNIVELNGVASELIIEGR